MKGYNSRRLSNLSESNRSKFQSVKREIIGVHLQAGRLALKSPESRNGGDAPRQESRIFPANNGAARRPPLLRNGLFRGTLEACAPREYFEYIWERRHLACIETTALRVKSVHSSSQRFLRQRNIGIVGHKGILGPFPREKHHTMAKSI